MKHWLRLKDIVTVKNIILSAIVLSVILLTFTNEAGETKFGTSKTGLERVMKVQHKMFSNDVVHNIIMNNTAQCAGQEVRHLYFLKVHKAASTTTQNIFLRFGMTRNLSMMTLTRIFMSTPIRKFDSRLPKPPPQRLENGKYDIYCEHSIYDEAFLMRKLHPDTVNIAIIREPLAQLKSFFNHLHPSRLQRDHNAFSRFMNNTSRNCPHRKCRLSNPMSREFGYAGNSTKSFAEYLKYLESKFFVLIYEYLSESLLIMKKMLCWPMKDILYSQARIRNYPGKNLVDTNLSKRVANWNRRDDMLYQHFKRIMENRIQALGQSLQQEVSYFDHCLAKTRDFCDGICHSLGQLVKKTDATKESFYVIFNKELRFEKSEWENEFTVSGLQCLMMRLDPEHFRRAQKVLLYPQYCSPNNEQQRKHINMNTAYCQAHFNYTFPWSMLRGARFVDDCY